MTWVTECSQRTYHAKSDEKLGYPKENTQVCDLGNRVQPTHLSREE
ncbi:MULTISPECIES: hypothetical protein [Providencia]|nr:MULTISPECIES: hypothetical protein [Providencia]ELR5295584.1 hypothetical protein [Providencia rettgeri]MBG5922099.1 hypothetical protein [Providencia rettgeri]MCL0013502.1 hypothetical protein [Providencia rettgeri]MDH2365549.1 hypothetical protein [Providencia rettgeri]HEM8210792.1 hypothetical protein [Providencia rettgeri]